MSLLANQALPFHATEGTSKQGFLTKQGSFIKSWKKRYFILRSGALFYFTGPEAMVPLGQMSLYAARVDLVPSSTVGLNAGTQVLSVTTPARSLLLQCPDSAELSEWAIVIQKAALLETRPKGLCPPSSDRGAASFDSEFEFVDSVAAGGVNDEVTVARGLAHREQRQRARERQARAEAQAYAEAAAAATAASIEEEGAGSAAAGSAAAAAAASNSDEEPMDATESTPAPAA